jgi:hypothetical protein
MKLLERLLKTHQKAGFHRIDIDEGGFSQDMPLHFQLGLRKIDDLSCRPGVSW